MTEIICPRCGARDSFMKGYLPDTCVCRVCQSQLDWREIPECGPDCKVAGPEPPPPPTAPNYVKATAGPAKSSEAAPPPEPSASGKTVGVTEPREGAGDERIDSEDADSTTKDPAPQERRAEER